eukprot:UN06001
MGLGYYSTVEKMKGKSLNGAYSGIAQPIVEFCIMPDILTTELTTELPTEQLEVEFNNKLIEPAQELSPSESSIQPHVRWKGVKDKNYTLMMVDPDPPSRRAPFLKDILHWMVINIPSNELQKGITLASYRGPGPPPFTGLHRYVLLLYEQEDEKGPDTIKFTKMNQRMKFKTTEFAKKNNLKLIGASFYISQNKLNKPLWFVPYLMMAGIGVVVIAGIYSNL